MTGRIKPKAESTFGKPKKSWGFGKPKKYEAPEQKEVNDVEIPEINHKIMRGNSESKSNSINRNIAQKIKIKERLDKQREKTAKGKNERKHVLALKDYCAFLHQEYGAGIGKPMEIHHWMPRSKIKQNDYFVCCLHPDEHRKIHSSSTVKEYIEKIGMQELLSNSFQLMTKWLESDGAKRNRYYEYVGKMMVEISKSPLDYEHVLNATRGCAEDIRLSKR
jgi:hypothetical protein